MHPEWQEASISSPAPSLLSAFFLRELHHESAASPELSSPYPAKLAHQKLHQSLLHLDVTSLATVKHR